MNIVELYAIHFQLLKSLAVIVGVCAYNRCAPELLANVVNAVADICTTRGCCYVCMYIISNVYIVYNNADANIRVGALNCFGSMLTNTTITDCRIDSLLLCDDDWLWSLCMQYCVDNEPLPVRLEAFQTLVAFTAHAATVCTTYVCLLHSTLHMYVCMFLLLYLVIMFQ